MPLNAGVADVLATPAAPTVVQNSLGTGAAISYQLVAVNAAGMDSVPSAPTITAATNAATPNNAISWTAQPGVVKYRVLKNGNLLTTIDAGLGVAGTLSFTDSAGSAGSTYTSATYNPPVVQAISTTDGMKFSYSAAVNAHAPAATPTDWFTILGSATKTIRITRLTLALRATAANQYRVSLIKYSTAYSGGTAAAATIVPHDSANPAATAVINTWAGGLPTPGSAVGKIADDSLPVGVLGTPTFNNEVVLYDFGIRNGQSIVLRGTAQYLAINSNSVALPAGFVGDVRVEWTEE